jgi:hypothetical protein
MSKEREQDEIDRQKVEFFREVFQGVDQYEVAVNIFREKVYLLQKVDRLDCRIRELENGLYKTLKELDLSLRKIHEYRETLNSEQEKRVVEHIFTLLSNNVECIEYDGYGNK